MKDKIDHLCSVLEEEIEVHKALLSLLLEERKFLTAANLEELDKNLKKQEKIFSQVDLLENQRLEILQVFLKEIYGDSWETITVDELFSRLEDSDRLTKLRLELKEKIRDIMKINRSNNFLIKNGLTFIEKNIETFFGSDEKEKLYNPRKDKNQKKQVKNLINWKV